MYNENKRVYDEKGYRTDYLSIGDVVLITYPTFENQPKVGLFVVVYDNSNEDNEHELNFMGCKFTTKKHDNYKYYVDIPKGCGGNSEDCKCCCSLLHIMHKKQIIRVIGHLPSEKMKEIKEKLDLFKNEIDKQFKDVI